MSMLYPFMSSNISETEQVNKNLTTGIIITSKVEKAKIKIYCHIPLKNHSKKCISGTKISL